MSRTFVVGQGPLGKGFYLLIRNLLTIFCRLYLRLRIIGKENIPKKGAFILAPTHRSNMDTPIVCGVTMRRLRYMGKNSLWKNPLLGGVLSALGGFPVTRGTADLEALRRCLAVLKDGEPLVLFPEGTRQFGPTVQPLFDGASFLAIKGNVPIIPVGIGGSEDVMPKGSKMIYPRRCRVVIGTPIAPPEGSGRNTREVTGELTTRLATALQELFDRAQQLAS